MCFGNFHLKQQQTNNDNNNTGQMQIEMFIMSKNRVQETMTGYHNKSHNVSGDNKQQWKNIKLCGEKKCACLLTNGSEAAIGFCTSTYL